LCPVPPQAEQDEYIAVTPVPFTEALEMVKRGEVQNIAAICGLLAVARWFLNHPGELPSG